jgi:predicted metal-binding membrane protein
VTYEPLEFARVGKTVLLLSAIAWILLLLEPRGMPLIVHCLSAEFGTAPPESFQIILATNPPASLVMGWAVMLVAMMSPILIAPICHIRLRSFTYRRARSVTLFVSAYAALWTALGCVLLAIELATMLFAPKSYLPFVGIAIITLVWQVSPLKQRCLNRCHAHAELAAFGVAADVDALRFGMTHGIWCAGSCWALMLFPMVLPRGQVLAMAAVAVLIFGERLEQPTPPCWRWRGHNKAIRFVVAQARIRLDGRRLASAAISSGI